MMLGCGWALEVFAGVVDLGMIGIESIIAESNSGNISMSARDFAKFCKELLSA